MNKEKTNRVLEYFNELFPDAYCELNHETDFQLLVAVMLSAQTTDKKVNQLTESLFKKYPDVYTMANANLSVLQEDIKTIGLYRNKAKNLLAMAKTLIEKWDSQEQQRKSITLSEIEAKGIEITMKIAPRIDYLAAVNQFLENKGEHRNGKSNLD